MESVKKEGRADPDSTWNLIKTAHPVVSRRQLSLLFAREIRRGRKLAEIFARLIRNYAGGTDESRRSRELPARFWVQGREGVEE